VNKLFAALLIFALIAGGCAPAGAQPPAGVVEVIDTQAPAVTQFPTLTALPLPTATETSVPTQALTPTPQAVDIDEVIDFEMRGSFAFFWERANTTPGSPGYGLIRDRFPGSPGVASIASVGFGLTAYLIGIEKGYISYDEGYERVDGTLDTLLALDRVEGFYFHFLDMETGKRVWNSEVSNIDTAILLMGVLSAGEYFGGEIAAKAQEIYDGVNWPWFIDPARNMFHMAYFPEKGFEGHWDFYAEQLMMYVLAAGSDTHPIDSTPFYTFTRHYAKYGEGEPFIHSWFGSIFTYQFSHAWIDFREYTDQKGVNWFENSVEASLAQVSFATNMDHKYETLGPDAWGLTASDGPNGYNGLYGAPPSGFDNRQHVIDDTIAPAGAIGSIIFVPEHSLRAMEYYYSFEKLKGPYGFQDAFNLTENWFAPDVIGIDKGISLLMLANYENDQVYEIVMKNQNILTGLQRLGLTPEQ
jgi:hypothetical protein